MENLKVDVVETKACSITLNIEVPHPEVLNETNKVFGQIHKAASIAGFRQGKAPLEMVKKKHESAAREKVIENLLQKSAHKALKDHGVDPINTPMVEEVTFDFDKPFSFKIKAEKDPDIKVKNYRGIKIKKEITRITDKSIEKQIDTIRERNSKLIESKSDSVNDKSFVMADYKAFLGSEEIPEMKSNNQLIDLSGANLIAGFKEGMVGMKKLEEKDVNVKFQDDYPNKKLAGKDIVFKIKVNEIKEKELPEANDDFAKDIGLKSFEILKEKVKETMEAEEKNNQNHQVENQIIDHLLKENEFEVPESLVESQFKYLLNKMSQYFQKQGLPKGQWEENLDKNKGHYKTEAEKNVRISYILNAVAKAENMDASEEELNLEYEKMKKQNEGRKADVDKYFHENKSKIYSQIKEEKLFKFLKDNAKIKEVEKK